MPLPHTTTIIQYNTLLSNLNLLGRYQILIYTICTIYWMLAGILRTSFDLGFQSFECSYSIGLFQAIGLLIFSYTSNSKGCKKGILVANIIVFIGFLLILFPIIKHKTKVLGTVGLSMMAISISTQPTLILSIVCQLTTPRIIQIVFCFSLIMHNFGKIITVLISTQIKTHTNPDLSLGLYLLAPSIIISLSLLYLINDSPRYLIQNDFHRAQKLINIIAKRNGSNENLIMKNIDENFMIKRVHLKKYNYLTLSKFNSLGFSQYCISILMVLIGIISNQSHYILQLKSTTVPPNIQIIWLSSFQILGILSSLFFLKSCKRRQTCLFISFLVALVSTILYFIYDNNIQRDLVLLGLSGVFSIMLFSFLVVNIIEFYPHSVRTLGLGFMFSLYCFGQLFFKIYLLSEPNPSIVLQLFLWSAWIMVVHSYCLKETLNIQLSYEIQEIQQQQNQEI